MNYGGDAADQIVRYSMGRDGTYASDFREYRKKSGSFHRSSVKRPEKDLWKDTDGTYDQRTKADQIFYRAG